MSTFETSALLTSPRAPSTLLASPAHGFGNPCAAPIATTTAPGRSFEELVRRPPLPPGKTPMDMRAETPR